MFILERLAPTGGGWEFICETEGPVLGFAAYFAAVRSQLGGTLRLSSGGRVVARDGASDGATPRPKPAAEWAIYNLDADLRFMSANPAALAYWGVALSQVLSRRLLEAFPEAEGSPAFEAHLKALRSFEVFRGEVVSPVLRRMIELAIFPHARGLRVAFRLAAQRGEG